MIIDGSNLPRARDIGFVIERLRQHPPRPGHRRFGVGVGSPGPLHAHRRRRPDPGQLHRRVSALSGRSDHRDRTSRAEQCRLVGQGNTQQGVVLGRDERDLWAASTAGRQRHRRQWCAGRADRAGATGNQVLGNQIGVVGPSSSSGCYLRAGNGAGRHPDRVVEQHDRRRSGRGQSSSRPTRRRRPYRRCRRDQNLVEPTISAPRPAAAISSGAASPATAATASRSTTRPTTRSAAIRSQGNVISVNRATASRSPAPRP